MLDSYWTERSEGRAMTDHIAALRDLCSPASRSIPPYILRTRFERSLFGLAVSVAQWTGLPELKSLVPAYVDRYLEDHAATSASATLLTGASDVLQSFAILCDSSNWSPDGQDPRIDMCREEVLALCDECTALFIGAADA